MKGYYTKAYAVLDEKKADAILVSDGYNMRYLSGFRGATGYLYISKKRQVLMTDSRYTTMAKEEAPDFEVQEIATGQTYGQMVYALITEEGAQHVAYEDAYMLCKTYQGLQEACEGKIDIPLGDSLDLLRAVKEEWELEYLARAESIGDQAFTHILDVLKPGITELEVAAELEYFMKTHGAENLSFESIVASGPNSAMPHAMPSGRKLEKGDFVTMDFGCLYQGYCSDTTRTFAVGYATEEMKKVYNVVLQAQLAGIAVTKAGVTGAEVDGAARKVISDAGYGDYFGHSYGHGVGLEIHEGPNMSFRNEKPIPAGAVTSAEPGIYLPGKFGVRIEDVTIVTENGCEDITNIPKDLLII